MRSSSCTASCARSSAVGALSTPTYTRIGSSAGSPLNCSRAATSGPRPMKLRPCMPSESQVTSEPGPPERSELVGFVAPFAVVSLVLPYTLSASDDAWVRNALKAISSGMATMTAPSRMAAVRGIQRESRLPTARAAQRSRRATTSRMTQMSSAMGRAAAGDQGEPGSSVMSSRVWLFHTPPT